MSWGASKPVGSQQPSGKLRAAVLALTAAGGRLLFLGAVQVAVSVQIEIEWSGSDDPSGTPAVGGLSSGDAEAL